MIKHIVFWKINKDGTDSDRRVTVEAFRKKTEYLQTIIPQIKSATVGFNVNEGDVFHVCIDSVFDSLEDLNTYIDHPEHQKVRAFMNEIASDTTVFDSEFCFPPFPTCATSHLPKKGSGPGFLTKSGTAAFSYYFR